jgi:polysaccharide export outer membrane protein
MTHPLIPWLLRLALGWLALAAVAQALAGEAGEYRLGPGDIVRITVFQNPDLTTEARVSEAGAISFPLVGTLAVGGLTVQGAERLVGERLREGGFVLQPQVNLLPLQIRGNQVAVLGQVNRPGRFPLEISNTRLSDMLAVAGGIASSGADTLYLTGVRDGRVVRRRIDVVDLLREGAVADEVLAGGDVIFVDRAPMFYIYGEVQRPGAFRLEREMTVMQALALGGGVTARGTVKGLQVHRRQSSGDMAVIEPSITDRLEANDVLFIKESLF